MQGNGGDGLRFAGWRQAGCPRSTEVNGDACDRRVEASQRAAELLAHAALDRLVQRVLVVQACAGRPRRGDSFERSGECATLESDAGVRVRKGELLLHGGLDGEDI